MKNEDVVKEFINSHNEVKTKHLFIERNVLYSYGYHFPLCIKLIDGFIINLDGYSNTTANHKGILIRKVTDKDSFKEFEKDKQNHPNIVLMDTNQIKEFVNKIRELNINTIEDLNNFLMLNELKED